MYANQYLEHNNYVYGSHDGGDTWSVVWNLADFGESAWHTHTVRTDPFTGDLYVATGDVGDDVQIWHYNHTTTTWTQLTKGRTNSSYPWVDMWLTDFAFDANYVYGGADTGDPKVQRWVRGNSPWTAQGMISAGGYGKKTWDRTNFVKQFENVDGILLFGTADGLLMGSWDGEHWLTLYAIDDTTAVVENIARRRAKDGSILAADYGYGKIIKLHIDAEVMAHLYFNEFVSESDSTVKYSQIIRGNGTNYIDLSGSVLSDAQLTLYGVSRKNYLVNGTFENGGTAADQGWRLYDKRYGDVYVDTNNPYAGVYCLNSTVTATWQGITTTYFRTGINTRIWRPLKSHIAVVSFWARTILANASTDGIQARFDFGNGTNSDYDATTFAVNDTWRFIRAVFTVPLWATDFSVSLNHKYANTTIWWDNIQLTLFDSDIIGEDVSLSDSSEVWGKQYIFTSNTTVVDNMLNTTNPTVTIDGTNYSHSGELANNTASQTWPLGEIGGMLEVPTTVSGSGMVNITITGTIKLSLSDVLLRNWDSTNNVGYGLYVGTPTITTSQDCLLVLTKMTTTNITSASYGDNKLSFTVSAKYGFTSITKVYVANKGKPSTVLVNSIRLVEGTVWRYNDTLNEVAIDLKHTTPTFEIELSWNVYSLIIDVSRNHILTNANISLFDENIGMMKIETIQNVSSHEWLLPEGTYYSQAFITYNGHSYSSDWFKVNLNDSTMLIINFQFSNLTVLVTDIQNQPLENALIKFNREAEVWLASSNKSGSATIEAYCGNWTIEITWMGVKVGESNITLNDANAELTIKSNVGDVTINITDQHGEPIKSNVTLTNARYFWFSFSGDLNGTATTITFTQIPLINYTLTVEHKNGTQTYTIDASQNRQINIEITNPAPKWEEETPYFLIGTLAVALVTASIIFIFIKKRRKAKSTSTTQRVILPQTKHFHQIY
jgi:hypothetical protein